MIRRVAYTVWNELIRDYVEHPLDDADSWTIAFANQVNSRDLTDREFSLIVSLFNADVAGGVDI